MKTDTLIIGIPLEVKQAEQRVAATPETVKKMIGLSCKVLVQTGAGIGRHADYSDWWRRYAGGDFHAQ